MDDDWPEDDLAAALTTPSPDSSSSSSPSGASADGLDAVDPTVQTTEWFSVEEYLADEDEAPVLPRRLHHVTAVIVSHDGSVWLPAVLTTLAQQSRPVDAAVGVDTGSVDHSPRLLSGSFGSERTVVMDHRAGFGEAVRAGLAKLGRAGHRPFTPDPIEWVWLLHDDSAPSGDCLRALLDTADDNPSVAILGPKVLGWHDRRLLLEAGVTVTGSGRRVTGLDKREHDQGQHDGVRDVLAVSSAGMLVRRDVWDALDGFDPALPLFRDDLDFCWRAHRMGERVIVATDAVIHHREASAHGRRADDVAPRPHRADREAAVHVLLAQATALTAPFVALRLFLGSLVRGGAYLLGKDVAGARDEVGAVLAVALHPSTLRSSRARVARTSTEPASVVRQLRPTPAAQVRQVLEVVGAVATTSGAAAPSASVSALDSGPTGDDADFLDDGSAGLLRRLFIRPGVILTLALAVVTIIATRGLWLGDGVLLQGGALLPSPQGAGDIWETYRQAWHDVGPGSTTPAPPYLAVITAVAIVLLGKAPAAVTLLLLLAIPIAGWSAYFAMRGLVASTAVRVWAGAAYALLPAMTGAVAGGRIGTTMAAIALPFALRSLVRIAGPQGTLRRSAGTAILVAVVLAVAPTLWLILLIAGAVVAVYLFRTRGNADRGVLSRLALALLGPLVLLMPWTIYVITQPTVMLLEPGLNTMALTDPELEPWDVLLLHPGGPGMTPIWLTVGIVIGAFLALLRTDRFRIIGAMAAIAGLALLMGMFQTMVMVTPPGATNEVRPWPGQATLLLGLMMIGAAAVAIDGLRDRMVGRSFSIGQPIAIVVAIAALLAPALSAVWFGAGLRLDVRRAPATSVPAFVAADSEGAQAPRTLVIDDDVAGRVTYSLLNGAGPELGDAETGPPASDWEALDPYVAAMASGRGGDEVEALAGYGIRYVVLARDTSRDLIPTLDAEPGLRRLSSSGGEVLWRVGGTTSRARIVADAKQTPVGLADRGRVTADPYIDQAMPDGAGTRILVTGAGTDGGWHAASVGTDGSLTELEAVAGPKLLDWSQGFVAPEGAPRISVWFDSSARTRWLWLQGIVLLVLIVMALPERRREDPDPDIDDPDPDTALAIEVEAESAIEAEAMAEAVYDDEPERPEGD